MEKIRLKDKPKVSVKKIINKMRLALIQIIHPITLIVIAILITIKSLLIGVIYICDKVQEALVKLFYLQKGKKKNKDIYNRYIGSFSSNLL
ncbi:MAG: hypothetical protein ACFFB0_19175 [Promethearchaeota archaeon]